MEQSTRTEDVMEGKTELKPISTQQQPVFVAQSLAHCSNNPQGNGVHLWDVNMNADSSRYVCKLCGLKT